MRKLTLAIEYKTDVGSVCESGSTQDDYKEVELKAFSKGWELLDILIRGSGILDVFYPDGRRNFDYRVNGPPPLGDQMAGKSDLQPIDQLAVPRLNVCMYVYS